jgi:hypothetical protein
MPSGYPVRRPRNGGGSLVDIDEPAAMRTSRRPGVDGHLDEQER